MYKCRLIDFIKLEYGIEAANIAPAKRGFYGETWRITAQNSHYFLKIIYCNEHKLIYEKSFPVIQYLCDNGIDFIGKIVKTKSNELSTQFDGAVVGVFDWIDGENVQNEETKILEYQMLARVYAIPTDGLIIMQEDFSSRCSDEFWTRKFTQNNNKILTLLENKREMLEYRTERLKLFSKLCRNDKTGFVITHGDAGGNFFVSNDSNFIVDWDGVFLVPPERDAWFMCSRDWAQNAFHSALKQNGINYKLRSERLAFYCYQFFFFYLNTFIDAGSGADVIEEFISGWIKESFQWADNIIIT
jgi:hypothetical protein